MKKFAVLGSPIEHSKSPLIHQVAFKELGVDALYERFELATGLKQWLSEKDSDWQGFSLTMPLKEQALDLANRADPLAITAQAANTLIRSSAGWDAYNTDVFGIQMALDGRKFSSVAVIGTGATARSAIVAMLDRGKSVSVWGRNPEKVNRLAAEFEIEPLEKLHVALGQPAVISTVVAGALDNQLTGEFRGTLLDVVYDPWPTELSKHFKPDNVISGLEMLIWQGIGQQRLFNGLELDEALPRENNLLRAIREAIRLAK